MGRIVRIDLDETSRLIERYADRYRSACGRDVRNVLVGGGESEG